jgi:hypothetical protein
MEPGLTGQSRNGEGKDRSGDRRRGGSQWNPGLLPVARSVEAGSGLQGERHHSAGCSVGRGTGSRRFCKAAAKAHQASRAGMIQVGLWGSRFPPLIIGCLGSVRSGSETVACPFNPSLQNMVAFQQDSWELQ